MSHPSVLLDNKPEGVTDCYVRHVRYVVVRQHTAGVVGPELSTYFVRLTERSKPGGGLIVSLPTCAVF
ncbi:hypothetical protein J6590_003351 [Homalodisca vitripennis]|nr:hypothetical protein J6590_003351 [Homalodisca vitripennis]